MYNNVRIACPDLECPASLRTATNTSVSNELHHTLPNRSAPRPRPRLSPAFPPCTSFGPTDRYSPYAATNVWPGTGHVQANSGGQVASTNEQTDMHGGTSAYGNGDLGLKLAIPLLVLAKELGEKMGVREMDGFVRIKTVCTDSGMG